MSSSNNYDAYWQSGIHVTQLWEPEYFQKHFGVLSGRQRVLDYGCGMGYGYQKHLVGCVKEYVGADVSDVALESAKQRGLSAVKICEDSSVALPSGTFDGAVCSEVFEHLWDPLAAARELHRILQPGGILVASVPNFGYHPWRLMALLRAQVPMEPDINRFRGVHIRFFSLYMFRRLLLEAGFKNVRVGGWCNSSIFDVMWCAGPYTRYAYWCHDHVPRPFHLPFLGKICPSIFSERLLAVAEK
jgi:2-polyprenyl-6-hydroxyphenyl methylase/3-demethylubiquinone-9 3-methyltransferase